MPTKPTKPEELYAKRYVWQDNAWAEKENTYAAQLQNNVVIGGEWIDWESPKTYGEDWYLFEERLVNEKTFPFTGWIYYPEHDVFIEPQPYPSWSLDMDIFHWVPPTPFPNDGERYQWDEITTGWIAIPSGE
jgi:hypothetical protein